MKAMRLEGAWGLDNLREVELPDPKPGPDEVLIRMEAVSINPRDRIVVEGGYGRMAGPLPLIPLCDGVGRIVELGNEVSGLTAGDMVCAAYSRTWLHGTAGAATHEGAHGSGVDGTMCELMAVPAEAVVKAPSHMDAAEAATLPCAAVTAWNAVVEEGEVRAGDTVLLQGTGGVSLFALQFAKMSGARVILISSSDEKLERAQTLGADHVINYRAEPDWHKATKKITGGQGGRPCCRYRRCWHAGPFDRGGSAERSDQPDRGARRRRFRASARSRGDPARSAAGGDGRQLCDVSADGAGDELASDAARDR